MQFPNYREHIWRKLVEWRNVKYPTLAGTYIYQTCGPKEEENNRFEKVGLLQSHAYSIVGVEEVVTIDAKRKYK